MNTYGTKQHWIPAAVLGRFRDSQSKAKKRVRENEIIIRRRGQIGLSVNKAGAICFKKGLYDINPQTARCMVWNLNQQQINGIMNKVLPR